MTRTKSFFGSMAGFPKPTAKTPAKPEMGKEASELAKLQNWLKLFTVGSVLKFVAAQKAYGGKR